MKNSKVSGSNARGGKWSEVTCEAPCVICGKPDWCAVSADGGVQICRRLDNGDGVLRTDASGVDFWFYGVGGRKTDGITYKSVATRPAAEADVLDRVYRSALGKLELTAVHRADLLRRGLTNAEIDRNGYGTLRREGRRTIARKLVDEFGEDICKAIPGLAVIGENGTLFWKLFGAAGLAVPVRDLAGRIVALKIRRDDVENDDGAARYTYVSSRKHGGTGPGAPVHVPMGIVTPSDDARLTEGEPKADIAFARTGLPTLSIPGVSAWRRAIPVLRAIGATHVRLAFDSDSATNPNVARALDHAGRALMAEGFSVTIETWDPASGKGIDDVLVGGGTIESLPFVAVTQAETPSHPPKADLPTRIKAERRLEGEEWPALRERLEASGLINEIARAIGDRRYLLNLLKQTLSLSSAEIGDLKEIERQVGAGIRDDLAAERRANPDETHADTLVALASKAELFHDDANDAYAIVTVGGHREVHSLDSVAFRHWLTREYLNETQRACSATALADAIRTVAAKARFDSPERRVHVRLVRDEGSVYYDLGDALWRQVRITPDGWSIVSDSPVLFRRFSNTKAQVEPVRGGSLMELFDFINVKSPVFRQLIVTWLVSGHIPGSPRMILALAGEQGSAKTTTAKMLRRLIDPAKAETIRIPRKPDELAQALAHNWLVCFDNLSHLTDEASDALCSAVSGDGFTKRKLYTDLDDCVLSFQRLLLMTGIGGYCDRADLLDRTLIGRLDPFLPDEIRSEEDIWEAFEAARPRLLGAVFDAVAGCLKVLPGTAPVPGVRMADFSRIGVALEGHLGYGVGSFVRAIRSNTEAQVEEAMELSVIGPTVRDFAESAGWWEGTPTALLGAINAAASADLQKEKGWPKSASAFGMALRRLSPALRKLGVSVDTARPGGGKERRIKLAYIGPPGEKATKDDGAAPNAGSSEPSGNAPPPKEASRRKTATGRDEDDYTPPPTDEDAEADFVAEPEDAS